MKFWLNDVDCWVGKRFHHAFTFIKHRFNTVERGKGERPSCKGYSPCKILTLAQNLKFQKTCQNPFYKSFTVVLCKKTAPENTKYSRNEGIFKIGHHACKGYSPCEILTLAQKLKFQKTCQNPFYKSFTVVL